MTFSFRRMTPADRRVVSGWHWPDAPLERAPPELEGHVDHVAIDEAGAVAGYCTFGPNAMVPERFGDERFIDIAYGLRPDLVGRGHGAHFIGAVVVLARELFPTRQPRIQVRESDPRALRAATDAGFREVERLHARVIAVHGRSAAERGGRAAKLGVSLADEL